MQFREYLKKRFEKSVTVTVTGQNHNFYCNQLKDSDAKFETDIKAPIHHIHLVVRLLI